MLRLFLSIEIWYVSINGNNTIQLIPEVQTSNTFGIELQILSDFRLTYKIYKFSASFKNKALLFNISSKYKVKIFISDHCAPEFLKHQKMTRLFFFF